MRGTLLSTFTGKLAAIFGASIIGGFGDGFNLAMTTGFNLRALAIRGVRILVFLILDRYGRTRGENYTKCVTPLGMVSTPGTMTVSKSITATT